jgi:hypothetical protein
MGLQWNISREKPVFERVSVDPASGLCPVSLRGHIVVDTLHDGDLIPEFLMHSENLQPLVESGRLWSQYLRDRDWGANAVARHVAAELGLSSYFRVNLARAVMDFNRFPGSNARRSSPKHAFAIRGGCAQVLSHEEKRAVLERGYDVISDGLDAAILGCLLKVSIHTYDAHNATRTRRPEISLLSRSDSYQNTSHLPFGLFDPLFPEVLVESSVHPILRDRVALTLEKAGLHVEHNYPYCLPDGSVEVRSQPWFFFQHLRKLFEEAHPDTREASAFVRVWGMLLNTNLRQSESGILSAYLHRFRRAPGGREAEFREAREAYEAIERYLRSEPELVEVYRRSTGRTSALCVEVRKDLLSNLEGGIPVGGVNEERAQQIGRQIAQGLVTFLAEDLSLEA